MCESFVYHPPPLLSYQSALLRLARFQTVIFLREVLKGSEAIARLACVPQHKELNNTRCAMRNWKAQCPKARALSSTLNYFCKEKLRHAVWPFASACASCCYLSATYGNLMGKLYNGLFGTYHFKKRYLLHDASGIV